MARALVAWGLVLLAGTSAVAEDVLLQFYFDGSPVGPDDVFEVSVGEGHTVGIFIDPDGLVYDTWWASIITAGAWDPFIDMVPAPGGDPVFHPPWDNDYEFGPYPTDGSYAFGGFNAFIPVDYAMVAVELPINIPEVTAPTILALHFDPVWSAVEFTGIPRSLAFAGDLELHVVPEPTAIGLWLAVGALAAVMGRRR